MNDVERDFNQRLNAIKEETCNAMTKLAGRYMNMKNWKVNFKYDWSIECSSSIDEDSNCFETDDAVEVISE